MASPWKRSRSQQLDAILESINRQVDRVTAAELPQIVAALKTAERELARDLLKSPAFRRGDEMFTRRLYSETLYQIQGTLTHVETKLQPKVLGAISRGAVKAGVLATSHLAYEVRTFSAMFEGAVRPVAFEAASVVAQAQRTLMTRFASSAKRYAGRVGDDIRHQLAVGVLRGESVDQLTKRISGRMPGYAANPKGMAGALFKGYRLDAERLVVTEVANAYNSTALIGLRELDDEDPGYKKQVDGVLDARLCAICASYNGTVVDLDRAFRGGKNPPFHPRCRCALIAWRKEWD